MAEKTWPDYAHTVGRSELLAMRGYAPEVVAGNGALHGPESAPTEAPGMDGPQSDQGERRCAECASPLHKGQARYCSPTGPGWAARTGDSSWPSARTASPVIDT